LIEGHTDDDRFSASGPIADNWDLSTKTAIVAILAKTKNINKQNYNAAGRGNFRH
jgi:chemotaxis protein MotB